MKTFLVVKLAPYSKAFDEVPVKTLGDMKTAWDRGYDFKISGGPYCSIRDISQMKADGIEGIIISHHTGTIQLPFGE
jgi:hypothetical protein